MFSNISFLFIYFVYRDIFHVRKRLFKKINYLSMGVVIAVAINFVGEVLCWLYFNHNLRQKYRKIRKI